MWFGREQPRFRDRAEAGRRLAEALERFRGAEPVVLALPRGGVPVAFEIARAFEAPLDLVIVRKIGAPGHEEYGIGALVDGAKPQIVLNDDLVRRLHVPQDYLDSEIARQLREAGRRRERYLRGRAPVPLDGRTAVVVDDGVATGGTMRAALRGLARSGARKVVLAVPVGPPDTIADLGREADEVVCLETPAHFAALSLHYDEFHQTTDEEVIAFLDAAEIWRRPGG